MIELLEESDIPVECVTLYFYLEYSPLHKKHLYMIDEIEKQYNNHKVFSVNVDKLRDMINKFRIIKVPTIIVLKDLREVSRVSLLTSMKQLKSFYIQSIGGSNV